LAALNEAVLHLAKKTILQNISHEHSWICWHHRTG